MYLTGFRFPSADKEFDYILSVKRTCYDSYYPFQILGRNDPIELRFEPITFLYGGNGSGKSTALNVIAEELNLERDTLFNNSSFFDDYVKLCSCDVTFDLPKESRIITSDDVFDYMINMRMLNDGISARREELFADYLNAKYAGFRLESIDDYEQLKRVNLARSRTQSKYVKKNLMLHVRGHSNGESAIKYFTDKIGESSLYLLDEPENSLSPEKQLDLMQLIDNAARFYGCQFVIATHSPFLLSMRGAKIYDLDDEPIGIKKWTELPNVKIYHDFFARYSSAFEL